MLDAFDAGRQPGDRPPAPGALALVQAFVNSSYDLVRVHGADLRPSPGALRDWLAERELIAPDALVTESDLERAVAVREGIRALLLHNNGLTPDGAAISRLNAVAATLGLLVCFQSDGPSIAPERAGVDGALGWIVAITMRAMLDGSWARLKACRESGCHWAFYDRSRNQTSAWCSMSVCGGRVKARRHYRSRRPRPDPVRNP
jgi:predicted RNA-binding Zn ribbon-like protein